MKCMMIKMKRRIFVLTAASVLGVSSLLTGCTASDSGYVKEQIAEKTNAEQTACNGTAHSIYTASQSAVTDMLAEDQWALSELDGVYKLSGSDFALVSAGSENPKDALKYRMTLYFTELKKVDSISFKIDGGSCIYVAVKDERGMYGTYPNQLKKDDVQYIDSLGEAALYAENGMSDSLK